MNPEIDRRISNVKMGMDGHHDRGPLRRTRRNEGEVSDQYGSIGVNLNPDLMELDFHRYLSTQYPLCRFFVFTFNHID